MWNYGHWTPFAFQLNQETLAWSENLGAHWIMLSLSLQMAIMIIADSMLEREDVRGGSSPVPKHKPSGREHAIESITRAPSCIQNPTQSPHHRLRSICQSVFVSIAINPLTRLVGSTLLTTSVLCPQSRSDTADSQCGRLCRCLYWHGAQTANPSRTGQGLSMGMVGCSSREALCSSWLSSFRRPYPIGGSLSNCACVLLIGCQRPAVWRPQG